MSINKYLLILTLAVILTGCGTQVAEEMNDTQVNNEQASQEESVAETVFYTLDEIAQHNSEESCWMALDGKVYDVTPMLGGHGGGDSILEGCGIDGTELYDTRPMGSGTPHSDKARSFLPKFYIGNLAQ